MAGPFGGNCRALPFLAIPVWQNRSSPPSSRQTVRTPKEFLHRLVSDGLRRRYRDRAAAMKPQIEQELRIIGAVGYEEYFLVVWSILQDCPARRHWNGSPGAARRTRSYAIAWGSPMFARSASASISAVF